MPPANYTVFFPSDLVRVRGPVSPDVSGFGRVRLAAICEDFLSEIGASVLGLLDTLACDYRRLLMGRQKVRHNLCSVFEVSVP